MRFTVFWPVTAILLASCSPESAPLAAKPEQEAGPAHAVILTVRLVPPVTSSAANLLRTASDAPPHPADTAEYIVRTDEGATLAIVQPADPGLRPGQGVTVGRAEPVSLIKP